MHKAISIYAKPLNKIIVRICSSNTTKITNPKLLDVEKLNKQPPVLQPATKEIPIVQTPVISNRIVRQDAGVVRLGFIPDEWFVFFFNKTGVSGFGTFCTTFSTFLVSKEFYVLEHEFYTLISMVILCTLATKYMGPSVAAYADKEIDAYENSLKKSRSDEIETLEEALAQEKYLQWSNEGQLVLVQAKRENVAFQLESEYRKRLMHCYYETKKRLDHEVASETVRKQITQKHMVRWIVDQVQKSITPEIQNESITKCIADLASLAKDYKPAETIMVAKT